MKAEEAAIAASNSEYKNDLVTPVVFEAGDLVTGWGQVLSDADGVWLDLSRTAYLGFLPPRRGRNSIRLLNADLSLVLTEFGPDNSSPGTATVTGRWLTDAIAVTEISPAAPIVPPGPAWQTPPCPPPDGGWPHGMNGPLDDNLTFDMGDLGTSGAAVTIVTFRPSPDQAVLVIGATDPDAVRTRLEPQLPGRLCIITSRWTRQQLNEIRDHLRHRWVQWGIERIYERIDDQAQPHIDVELVRITAEIAAWASTQPHGLLALDPILTRST